MNKLQPLLGWLLLPLMSLLLTGCNQLTPPAPYGVLPTAEQIEWQKMEYYMFVHFGPNTFTNVEWGDGMEDPKVFNPTTLDCKQWVETAKKAGMKAIIVTAKHHDGFCLWPSKYSTHTVRESIWRDGKGDVLRELSEACREAGLKFGVYLSPWDRNHPDYGTPEYNQVFANTLTEVLSNYGDVFEQWFDGANGEGPNGKRQEYDWSLFHETVYHYQPNAVIFSDVGPGCRWIGNEAGYAGETNWSRLNVEGYTPGYGAPVVDTLNSGNKYGASWVPGEADVSIRPGWFYSEGTDGKVKSVNELVEIYFASVGRNSNLLLNVPPDRRGLIHPNDSTRLMELREVFDNMFSHNLAQGKTAKASNTRGLWYDASNVLESNFDTYWATDDDVLSASIDIDLKVKTSINCIVLQEYIPLGQRITEFNIEGWNDQTNSWEELIAATTIGYKRILRFPTYSTNKVRVNIKASLASPILNNIEIYCIPEKFIPKLKEPRELLPYKNPGLSNTERTKDLLSRMTVEEKVGQILCALGWEMYEITGDDVEPSGKFKQLIQERQTGMLWGVYRADPWTKKTLSNGLNPRLAAKAGNALQRYVIENTRLGIPMFLAEEAPHGHMAIGTTVFPTGIGMAATWSPDLMRKVGEVIGKEVRLQGGHISYGPVLDLSRDPRWSRVEETFGEDPVLSGVMGAAMVEGLGGGGLSKPYSTIATLKHFLGYGIPEGGQNGNPTYIGLRELYENFLPLFKRAVDAGALSVMTSYNSLDGIPCTANSYLLTDILRDGWNFSGFVVSDLYSIEGLRGSHSVAPTMTDAAMQAMNAGVDVDLGGDAYTNLCKAIKERRISEAVVDSAVSRVLHLKFEMGLFENHFVQPEKAAKYVRNKEHIEVARKVAQESITLLENKNNILPLSKNIKKIAVVGPNANNVYNMLGDYTAPQEDSNVKTVLEGICNKLPTAEVEYVKGCSIRDTTSLEIGKAVIAAKQADVVIAVVGGSSARDFETNYKETGAAISDQNKVSDMESGEGFDRATLSLLGKQNELLYALRATGKPLVVIYIEGRPLEKNWSAEYADALLTAYYPGQEGGNAIADVLFGDYNPAGRLPMSVPRHVGQIPVYYNKKRPRGHDYVEMPVTPLYAFGYGLSYTTFDYSNISVKQLKNNRFEVSFDLKNTGKYDGDEVVQLYLRDHYASVVQPIQQLKHFERVFLKRGKSKRISFTLTEEDFAIIGQDMKKIVEPGEFTIMIGSSSDQIRLKKEIRVD